MYESRLRLTTRCSLKYSPNEDIRLLWQETVQENVVIDSIIQKATGIKAAKKKLVIQQKEHALSHVQSLVLQGASVAVITQIIPSARIGLWTKILKTLPSVIFCFVRKSLMQQLPTMSCLKRWGKQQSGACPLCHQEQTNKHVLSNCSSPSALQRYKLRHDAVLYWICNWIKPTLGKDVKLHADIMGFEPLSDLFRDVRPDIAVVTKTGAIHVCELTICHETNLQKSKQYKLDKYADLQTKATDEFKEHKIYLYTIELSVLGFLSDRNEFFQKVVHCKLPELLYRNLMTNVINNSYNIYLNRNTK